MSANHETLDLAQVTAHLQAGGQIPAELVEIFSEEAEGHMRTIYDGLDRIRVDRGNREGLADVRRASHTLKGAAAAVGMEAATRLAHRMEDLLDYVADNNLSISEDQVSLLLTTADQLQDLTAGEVVVEAMAVKLLDIYQQYTKEMGLLANGQPVETAVEEIAQSDDRADEVEESTEEISEGSDLEADASQNKEVAVLSNETASATNADSEESAASEQSKFNRRATPRNQSTQYLRVPLDRLDDLVKLVGEMIVNRSAFHQRLGDFESRIGEMGSAVERFRSLVHDVETRYAVEALKVRKTEFGGGVEGLLRSRGRNSAMDRGMDSLEFDRYNEFHLLARTLSETTNDVSLLSGEFKNLLGDFETLLGRQQRLNRDAQDGLMNIRMVPVSSIVNRLDRTVRSVSAKLSKKVNLVVDGEQTELDKTVLEEIIDPLQHLIRNALDHGVETPEQRAAAGKSETAQLTIEALNQGTQVTIRVTDDGRGIDVEKVRRLAIERGLVSENKELSDEQVYDLLFTPGFSTADSLTDVSGRGVGMDVVREAVQRLKGTIRVESRSGEGSTFTIHLPTTLAVTRALLVQSHGQTFAIPMQSVQQILRLDPTAVTKVGKKPIVRIGDQSVQLKELAQHLTLKPDDQDVFDQVVPLLLLQNGDDQIAVTIDAIEGSQDIVVKTLGDHLRFVPGLIGATVRGDGSVIPILDPADVTGQKRASRKQAGQRRGAKSNVVARRKLAMIVDDSISVRRVTTNLIRSAGWDVVDAKDGVDALDQLANMETLPDVFLTDMEMPRMDGIELVGRLRSQPEFADSPIVMVTSRASEKHRNMAIEAGANDHVVKPFNDEHLIELINGYAEAARETVSA